MNTRRGLQPRPPRLPEMCAAIRSFVHLPVPSPWQDFPHISEFPSGSGSRSPGPPNPGGSGDWDSSFPGRECGISACSLLPRDKSRYLT